MHQCMSECTCVWVGEKAQRTVSVGGQKEGGYKDGYLACRSGMHVSAHLSLAVSLSFLPLPSSL